MIRTLWFSLVVVVSSVIHATGVIVAALLGVKRRPGRGDVYDWGTNDWSRQVLWAAGTPVRAEGLDRIPDRPVVYAANHSSMFDIWALAATLPGSVRLVAKQELARIPLLGRAMVTAGHLTIDRAHPARAWRPTGAPPRSSGVARRHCCSPRGRGAARESCCRSRTPPSGSPSRPRCPWCRCTSATRSRSCPRVGSSCDRGRSGS